MTHDINIMGSPKVHETLLKLDNTAITGIQKLVQRTLILLFTDSSDPVNLGLGTSLGKETQGGNADVALTKGLFDIALSFVQDQLQKNTPSDAPADEQIQGYVTTANLTDRGTIEVRIIVTSVAGTTVTVAVPLKHLAV